MSKINIIITAYKEPKTIVRAVKCMEDAIVRCMDIYKLQRKDFLITVCAPDDETLSEALQYGMKNHTNPYEKLNIIKDKKEGKPAALNLCFKHLKHGEIFVLTDGDVYVDANAVANLLKPLLRTPFSEKIGAVCGHPISISDKNTKYGYWSHLLADMANKVRTECIENNNSIVCSGYLFAFNTEALPEIRNGVWIEENILSDDAFMSYAIEKNGYKIDYAGKANVYVKYPDNFKDWLNQKARSTGGYNQLVNMKLGPSNPMRSFRKEIQGLGSVLKYGNNIKEHFWTIQLIFARTLLWTRIFWERNLHDKEFKQTWVRIESTK